MTQQGSGTARFCTQCGAPAGRDQRWCTQCGAALAVPRPVPAPAPVAEPLASAPPEPKPADRPGSRRGMRIGLVCAIVLVAVFVAGAFLLLGRSGSGTDATGGASQAGPKGSARRPTESVATSPTASDPTTSGSPSTPYRCWSGTEARTLARCGRPRGLEGLAWVFPGIDLSHCVSGSAARELLYTCNAHLADGTPVTLHLSTWKGLTAALAHYDDGGQVARRPIAGQRYLWTSYDDRITTEAGPWKAAVMYRRAPYSLSLYAPTAQARREAMSQLIGMRAAAQLRGVHD